MPESFRVSDGLAKPVAILDVAAEVADAGVEDVVERVLPQEEVADDPHAPRVLVVDPQPPQIGYRVDGFLHLDHLSDEVAERHPSPLANLRHDISILFYETDDGFPIVFGDILGLVFHLLLCLLILIGLLFPLAVFILRNTLLVGDHPTFFIEDVVRELGKDGRAVELDHGAVLFLLLDDAVQHAVVLLPLGLENILQFDLAQFLTALRLVVVVMQGEVEDGGTIARSDQPRNVGNVRQQTIALDYAHQVNSRIYYRP